MLVRWIIPGPMGKSEESAMAMATNVAACVCWINLAPLHTCGEADRTSYNVKTLLRGAHMDLLDFRQL